MEYQKTEFKQAPHRFEAGTPDISGPIGLHAAMDYLDAIGRENIWRHDQELANHAYEKLAALKNIRLFGPKTGRAGLVSFLLKDVHAHDVVTLADQAGWPCAAAIIAPNRSCTGWAWNPPPAPAFISTTPGPRWTGSWKWCGRSRNSSGNKSTQTVQPLSLPQALIGGDWRFIRPAVFFCATCFWWGEALDEPS